MSHPAIVEVYDYINEPDAGVSYLIMAYVDGENLLALVSQAAVYLLEQELGRALVDDRAVLLQLLQLNQGRLEERIRKYRRQSISFTQPSQMVGRRRFNVFDVP